MDHKDISRIQVTLIPRVEELLTQWLIVHLLATTPSESPVLEDFSTQLSLLHIGMCFVIKIHENMVVYLFGVILSFAFCGYCFIFFCLLFYPKFILDGSSFRLKLLLSNKKFGYGVA